VHTYIDAYTDIYIRTYTNEHMCVHTHAHITHIHKYIHFLTKAKSFYSDIVWCVLLQEGYILVERKGVSGRLATFSHTIYGCSMEHKKNENVSDR